MNPQVLVRYHFLLPPSSFPPFCKAARLLALLDSVVGWKQAAPVKIRHTYGRGETMAKPEISLSPTAIRIINELLTKGEEVKIDVNRKTNELMVYRVPRKHLAYKVVVTDR